MLIEDNHTADTAAFDSSKSDRVSRQKPHALTDEAKKVLDANKLELHIREGTF